MSRTVLTRVAVALGLAASGCGGSDEGRLSDEEFRDRANQICADLGRDFDAIEEPESLVDFSAAITESRRILKGALDQLRDLEPPEELQADYDRFLGTGDETLDHFDAIKRAADEGDVAAVERIFAESEETDEESDAIARDLGLDACATA